MIQILLTYLVYVTLAFSQEASNFHLTTYSEIGAEHSDTSKYNGFRMDLTSFEVLKSKKTWVLLRFNAINTGRENLDFSNENHRYWTLMNFDRSFAKANLEPLKENIRQALSENKFIIDIGQIKRGVQLKVSVLPIKAPSLPHVSAPPLAKPVTPSEPASIIPTPNDTPADTSLFTSGTQLCPDILFKSLTIVAQTNRTATVQYTINNNGSAPFILIHKGATKTPSLVIRAFISGVPTLSRGALPVGNHVIIDGPGLPRQLEPGQSFSGHLEIDVRKKTRYLKSLILSLDSDQFSLECDKANNTGSVVLE